MVYKNYGWSKNEPDPDPDTDANDSSLIDITADP